MPLLEDDSNDESGEPTAFERGWFAFYAGVTRNPYETGTIEAIDWSGGWSQAQLSYNNA